MDCACFVSASEVARLERAAGRAWPAGEDVPLGGWRLRASLGSTRRANSIRPAAFADASGLEAAIDAAEAGYRARGLPCCFQINPLSRPQGLDDALARRGYAVLTPSWVMLADWSADAAAAAGVELLAEPDEAVMTALGEPGWPAAARREREEIFRRIVPPHRFALLRRDGEPVAGGLVVVDDGLAGIFAMRTRTGLRGRGLARRVLAALQAYAAEAGVQRLYLQVEQDNAPALALYRRFGFVEAYAYHYRELREDRPCP